MASRTAPRSSPAPTRSTRPTTRRSPTTRTNPNDPDDDGLPNSQEAQYGTDPNNPDTDGDGLEDGAEVNGLAGTTCRTNPLSRDTDGDKLFDGTEYKGFTMKKKVTTRRHHVEPIGLVKTNPCARDTDGDGIKDGKEVSGKKVRQTVRAKGGPYVLKRLFSDPSVADTDGDGLTDKQEITGSRNTKYDRRKTNPLNVDTDGGGVSDGREIKLAPTRRTSRAPPRRPHRRAERVREHPGGSRRTPWPAGLVARAPALDGLEAGSRAASRLPPTASQSTSEVSTSQDAGSRGREVRGARPPDWTLRRSTRGAERAETTGGPQHGTAHRLGTRGAREPPCGGQLSSGA